MAPSELNFITGNANKLAEVKAILGDTVALKNQSLDLVEIQGTVEEVSIDKCKRAAEIVSQLCSQVGQQFTVPKLGRWTSPHRRHMPVLQSVQ
jgi:inosine/xanthosine triphosphate pyrophosphatase family protein